MITVNNTPITEDAIATEMQYHPAETKRAAQVKAAESLIIGELFAQRAKTIGIEWPTGKTTPAEEEKTLEDLIAKEVAIPRATDEECEHYFAGNKDKFNSGTIVEARHILLDADPKDSQARDQMFELAEQLIERLKSDPSCFDELVKQSACPSKEQGGNLGQLSKGQTVPEFEKVLLAADEGLIDYPVESRYGYHITEITRKIPGKALGFEHVSQKIKQYLDEKVRRKAITQYITQLIGDAKIEGFDFNVDDQPLMQ